MSYNNFISLGYHWCESSTYPHFPPILLLEQNDIELLCASFLNEKMDYVQCRRNLNVIIHNNLLMLMPEFLH